MGNFTRELDGTLQGVAASVRAEAGEHLAGTEGRRTVQKCCFSLSVEISHVFYQKKKKKNHRIQKNQKNRICPPAGPPVHTGSSASVTGTRDPHGTAQWPLPREGGCRRVTPLRLGSPPAELVLK